MGMDATFVACPASEARPVDQLVHIPPTHETLAYCRDNTRLHDLLTPIYKRCGGEKPVFNNTTLQITWDIFYEIEDAVDDRRTVVHGQRHCEVCDRDRGFQLENMRKVQRALDEGKAVYYHIAY